jgi:hypothetical protein
VSVTAGRNNFQTGYRLVRKLHTVLKSMALMVTFAAIIPTASKTYAIDSTESDHAPHDLLATQLHRGASGLLRLLRDDGLSIGRDASHRADKVIELNLPRHSQHSPVKSHLRDLTDIAPAIRQQTRNERQFFQPTAKSHHGLPCNLYTSSPMTRQQKCEPGASYRVFAHVPSRKLRA